MGTTLLSLFALDCGHKLSAQESGWALIVPVQNMAEKEAEMQEGRPGDKGCKREQEVGVHRPVSLLPSSMALLEYLKP